MDLIEKFKNRNRPKRRPQQGFMLPQPEMVFLVPEGSLPNSGLTLEQQAIAEERQAELAKIIQQITLPYTQMLQTAATIRDTHNLGEVISDESGFEEIPYEKSVFGIVVGKGIHKKPIVTRSKRKTGWEVEKGEYMQTSSLKYSVYADDTIKVDHFNTSFLNEPTGTNVASLDLSYDENQLLSTASLTWDEIYPDNLARFMGENKAMQLILKKLAQPQSAVIRAVIFGLTVIDKGNLDPKKKNNLGGKIQYNLSADPSIDLGARTAPYTSTVDSQFRYTALEQKFVRPLNWRLREQLELADLPTQPSIPAQLALLGLSSMLSMITPEEFARG